MSKLIIGSVCGFGIVAIIIQLVTYNLIAALEMGLLAGAPIGGIAYCAYGYIRGAKGDKLKE